jgi:hypothetical protein
MRLRLGHARSPCSIDAITRAPGRNEPRTGSAELAEHLHGHLGVPAAIVCLQTTATRPGPTAPGADTARCRASLRLEDLLPEPSYRCADLLVNLGCGRTACAIAHFRASASGLLAGPRVSASGSSAAKAAIG